MAYIFMDESGDLGFDFTKEGTSKHFLVTALFVPSSSKRRVQKIVSNTHRTLKKKHKIKSNTLHAFKEKPITRHRLLRPLAKEDVKIMVILLNKHKVYTQLKDEKNVLYNYVVNILLDRVSTQKIIDIDDKIEFIASRKDTNRFLNSNFQNYLEGTGSSHNMDISVTVKTPHQEKCLQAVDFCSWAIFRKYEHQDMDYYNDIKSRIFEESWLFGE